MTSTPTLLSLPREIRDMIWTLAMPSGEKRIQYGNEKWRSVVSVVIKPSLLLHRLNQNGKTLTRSVARRGLNGPGLNLLLSNRQIRSEVEPVLYRRTFAFEIPEDLISFLFVVASKTHLIRSIRIAVVIVLMRDHSTATSYTGGRFELERKILSLAIQRLTGLRELNVGLHLSGNHFPDGIIVAHNKSLVEDLIHISTLNKISVTTELVQGGYNIQQQCVEYAEAFKAVLENHAAQLPGSKSGAENDMAQENGPNDWDRWDQDCLKALKLGWTRKKSGQWIIPPNSRRPRFFPYIF